MTARDRIDADLVSAASRYFDLRELPLLARARERRYLKHRIDRLYAERDALTADEAEREVA